MPQGKDETTSLKDELDRYERRRRKDLLTILKRHPIDFANPDPEQFRLIGLLAREAAANGKLEPDLAGFVRTIDEKLFSVAQAAESAADAFAEKIVTEARSRAASWMAGAVGGLAKFVENIDKKKDAA